MSGSIVAPALNFIATLAAALYWNSSAEFAKRDSPKRDDANAAAACWTAVAALLMPLASNAVPYPIAFVLWGGVAVTAIGTYQATMRVGWPFHNFDKARWKHLLGVVVIAIIVLVLAALLFTR